VVPLKINNPKRGGLGGSPNIYTKVSLTEPAGFWIVVALSIFRRALATSPVLNQPPKIMKKICSTSLALSLLLPAFSSAATFSFEVNGLGADPLNGTAWGYRTDLQTGPQAFSASADFVPTIMAGAEAPPVGGPWTGEGALVINGNNSGGLRTASMSDFSGVYLDGIKLMQGATFQGISLATSLGNIDYRWQKLTLNNSAAPNVKFQLWGLNGVDTQLSFLGSVVYTSVLSSAIDSPLGTWITETDIQTAEGWFSTQNTLLRGGYDQTLSGLLANVASNAGRDISTIVASDVQVGIGSSGSGGASISGAVDWITFDVDGGSFGDATIATNFIPEPTVALGGILCVLGLGIRRRVR
jgi:hypothetical protein